MRYMLMTQKQIYQKTDVLFSQNQTKYFDGGGQTYYDDVEVKGNIKEINKLKVTTTQEIPGNGSNTRSVSYPLSDFLSTNGADHRVFRNDNGEGYCAHEHMKYRIVSCKNLDKNLEKIIYGAKINNKGWGITRHYKEKVKLGKWIEGVYCITYPKANFQNYFVDDYPWKMIKPCLINNTTRNLKKKKILKQFKITPKDKLWYNPEIDWILYGWR